MRSIKNMVKLTLKKKKEINKFRSLFPSNISIRIRRSENGKFCAEIRTFPGCFTEADTFSGLIEMINDAVKTYFEIPKKYLVFMPEYLAPIKMAQFFNAFPVVRKVKDLKLTK